MDVEIFSDNSGTQFRRKIVVPNYEIAVVHIDSDRKNPLVHDIPLIGFIFSLGTVKLKLEKATYSRHKALIELSLDQTAKNSTILD